jgi:hypothetical protein
MMGYVPTAVPLSGTNEQYTPGSTREQAHIHEALLAVILHALLT